MMSMMGSGILYMIFWIVIIGFIIYGVLSLIFKAFENKKMPSESAMYSKEDSVLQILRERFARGEINEEEFKDKSAILGNKAE